LILAVAASPYSPQLAYELSINTVEITQIRFTSALIRH